MSEITQKSKNCSWPICGDDKSIMGCRFSLSVMSDDYVPKILDALKSVDTAHVYSKTDTLSTTYIGRMDNVINTIRDLFINVNDFKTHITLEMTLSNAHPGGIKKEIPMEAKNQINGNPHKKFDVHSKFAFYPMQQLDYFDHIEKVICMAVEKNIFHKSSHFASELKGDVYDIFEYFTQVFDYANKHVNHFVYQITLSINSPSQD